MTTRFKLLIAFFLGALMMLLSIQSHGQFLDWKQTLKQDLDGCVVKNVQYSNAFAEVKMTCNYYDGVVIGKSKQTLFISTRGYVIKWGR